MRANREIIEWAPPEGGVNEHDGLGLEVEGGRAPEGALGLDSAQLGLWVFLATVAMLFAGFTSAYLVRKAGTDWQPLALPEILWLNTALILLSSLTLELGRSRRLKTYWRVGVRGYGRLAARPHRDTLTRRLKGWLLTTGLLGVLFLAGQVLAWRELSAQGVYLPSNPHSSFFYILTGVHGVHLLGGVCALAYVLISVSRTGHVSGGANRLKLCATYWHFVGGLWLYLFLVLLVL